MSTPCARRISIVAVSLAAMLVPQGASAHRTGGSRNGRALAGARDRAGARRHRRRHSVTKRRLQSDARLNVAATTETVAQPLLGEASVGAETAGVGYGEAVAFPLQARHSGSASAIHLYLSWHSSSTTLLAGLFVSSGSRPGAPLATGSLRSLRSGAWNEVPIGAAQLVAGATYWLGVLDTGGGTLRLRGTRGAGCASGFAPRGPLAFPSQWRVLFGSGACAPSMYASGTVAAELPSTLSETPPVIEPAPAPRPPEAPAPESPAPEAPAPEAPAAPANTALPTIAGTPVEGSSLTASAGSWSGSYESIAYQWERCNAAGAECAVIGGASGRGYTPGAADVGHALRVTATASGPGGSTAASSAPTAAITAPLPAAPAVTTAPSISGQAVEGQRLEASSGVWSGSPSSYAYQWQDCTLGLLCQNIPGATQSRYTVAASDVGSAIRVIVDATNAGGSTAAPSALTALVTLPLLPPVATTLPAITGTAVEGQRLEASSGVWTGNPTSYSYQWQDCTLALLCTNIGGANSARYTGSAGDVGRQLRVVVTATNAAGSTPAASAATATVSAAPPAAPTDTVLPAISGSTVEGQTLEAGPGVWSGSPTSYAYAWQRCSSAGAECAAIAGAASARYTLLAADVGHTLRVVVTASNAGGSTPANSAASGLVSAKSGGGSEALFIGPSGSDANPCSEAQPCLTMRRGYERAAAGQTVRMLAGSYSAQTIEGKEKGAAHVVFAPASGARVTVTGTTYVFASHVTIEGLAVQDVTIGNYDQTPGRPNPSDVSLLGLTGRDFQIDSASHITVEGGSWGPASACGGPYGGGNNSIREPIAGVAPEYITIAGTVIHDVQSYNLTECHIEGLAIFAGNHVTVTGSHFYGNSVYDVFIQANSGGSPNNITLAGNWMAEAVDNSGANGHAPGWADGIVFGSEIAANLTLSENHFNGVVNVNDDGSISTYTNTVVQDNFGSMAYSGYPCGTVLKGVVWTKNVWRNDKCGSGDVNLEGAAMPYLDASNDSTMNYTLTGIYANWPSESAPAAPANTALPAITGTATQGQALSASTGSWSGSPTSYAYQWQDCNSAGASCVAIAGATSSSYTLAAGDVEHTVRVVVTATGPGGSGQASAAQTAVVSASSSGSSGVLFVSGSGSDVGVCSEVAPCRSLGRAYAVARAGEVVRVAAGSYSDSSLPLVSGKGSGAPVVFEPAGGVVRFTKLLTVQAHDVELKGFTFERELFFGESAENVVARGNALHNFEIVSSGSKAPRGISIIGGTAGPVADSSDNENNLIATNGPETTAVPTSILVEGVTFREYTRVGSAHVDCLQVWGVNELVVRGNTFKRCAVFDIFLQSLPNGSAGTPRNVLIENNVLEKTIEGFYSVFLPRHNEGNPEHFENVVIRNNSATQAISADPRAAYTNVKLDGNIAPQIVFWNEATEKNEAVPAGVSTDYNVLYGAGAKKNGTHDLLAPAGFANEAGLDLHLLAGAAAIKAGDPADYPTTDLEGNPRPNPPDAGALQH